MVHSQSAQGAESSRPAPIPAISSPCHAPSLPAEPSDGAGAGPLADPTGAAARLGHAHDELAAMDDPTGAAEAEAQADGGAQGGPSAAENGGRQTTDEAEHARVEEVLRDGVGS